MYHVPEQTMGVYMPEKGQEHIKIKYDGKEGYSVNTATGLIYDKDNERVEHPDYSKVSIMLQDGSLQDIKNVTEFVEVISSVNPKFTQETFFYKTAGELNKNGLTSQEREELVQLDSDLKDIDMTLIISDSTGTGHTAQIACIVNNLGSIAKKR
jgi:hypothetical protein